MRSLSRVLGGSFILGSLVIYLFFQFNQEILVFSPKPTPVEAAFLPYPISIERPNKVSLKGWQVKKFPKLKQAYACHALIYFSHGDEEVSSLVKSAFSRAISIPQLYMNYRGFGQSSGNPSHDEIVEDWKAIYDHYATLLEAKYPQLSPLRICALGKYLGAYFAVKLALDRPIKRLILLGAFSSLPALTEYTMPYWNFGASSSYLYDLLPLTKKLPLSTQTLVLYSPKDAIVPYQTTRILVDSWPSINPISIIRLDLEKLDLNNPLLISSIQSYATEPILADFQGER